MIIKVREEGGDALGTAEILLQPVDETTVEIVFPCNPQMSPHWSRYSHYSPPRTPCWSSWIFPEGTVAGGEPMLEEGESVGRKKLQKGVA